jgi:molybdopterin-synthase adenylyltransferase
VPATFAAAPARPRLKPSVEPFAGSDGHLYLLRPGGEAEFVIRDAPEEQVALIELLGEGAATCHELAGALAARGFEGSSAEAVTASVEQLAGLGLIEDAAVDGAERLPAVALERYDRQLRYFADAAPDGTDAYELQARLARARVVVLGCGGLGSWALCGLACAGVGHIVLVDDDTVELSNLNRQLLFRMRDLGRGKAPASADALRAFNPELELTVVPRRVRSAADVRAVADGADLLVETADWPPYELARWVNRACAEVGVAHVSAGQIPPMVRVGPFFLPGETGCLECQERAARRAFPMYDEVAGHRAARPSPAATLGPASGLVGSILAMEAVHHLTGICPPATLGAALMIDLRTLEVRREPVPREPGCSVCG